ncbi:hypothetical protein [Streptomyces sp. OE57]|uniref:hypothetical protein n=1 Tax=Streptomyces lacaronensis TaxID=3379885 RepID=UPI0039B73C39
MEMTKSLADNSAKIIPALGALAVAELRLIRKGVADYIDENPEHATLARNGFLLATVGWLGMIANIIYYEVRCLAWLGVENNPDKDPRLAHSLLWVIGLILVLLAIPPAVINTRQAVSGKVKKKPF